MSENKILDIELGITSLKNHTVVFHSQTLAVTADSYKTYYDKAEAVVVSISKHLEIKIDGRLREDISQSSRSSDQHSYHQAVLESLKHQSNPLHEILGQDPVGRFLQNARSFRNKWVHRIQNGASEVNIYKMVPEPEAFETDNKELQYALESSLECVKKEAGRRAANSALWETLRFRETSLDVHEQQLLLRERRLQAQEQGAKREDEALKAREMSLNNDKKELCLRERRLETKEQSITAAIEKQRQTVKAEAEALRTQAESLSHDKKQLLNLEHKLRTQEQDVKASIEKERQKIKDEAQALKGKTASVEKGRERLHQPGSELGSQEQEVTDAAAERQNKDAIEAQRSTISQLESEIQHHKQEGIALQSQIQRFSTRISLTDNRMRDLKETHAEVQDFFDYINTNWNDSLAQYRRDYRIGVVKRSAARDRFESMESHFRDIPWPLTFENLLKEVNLLRVDFETADKSRQRAEKSSEAVRLQKSQATLELDDSNFELLLGMHKIDDLEVENSRLKATIKTLWALLEIMSLSNSEPHIIC